MLRPFFLRLRDPVELDRLRDRFLEVIRSRSPGDDDHSLKIKLTSWEGAITPDVRVKFRIGLSTNLFGSDVLLSLRMRLSLIDVCWVFFFFSFAWNGASDYLFLEIDKRREKTNGMWSSGSRSPQHDLS